MYFILSPSIMKYFHVQKRIPLSGWFLIFSYKSKVLETVLPEVTKKEIPLENHLNITIKAFCCKLFAGWLCQPWRPLPHMHEDEIHSGWRWVEMNINLVSQLLCYPLPQGKFNFLLPFCLCHMVGSGGLHIILEDSKDLGHLILGEISYRELGWGAGLQKM